MTEQTTQCLLNIAKRINFIRRQTAVRTLAIVDATTKLPSPVLQIILDHLSSSLYPPQLLKEISRGRGCNDQVENEVQTLLKAISTTWSVFSIGQDPRHLHAFIKGAEATVYQKGLFQVEIKLPVNYPQVPPQMRYLTPILHQDVNDTGSPNLEKVVGTWSNAYNVELLLSALQVQMSQAAVSVQKREHWEQRARKLTQSYALWPDVSQKLDKLGARHLGCYVPEYTLLPEEDTEGC